MKVSIVRKARLEGIASASGVEIVNGMIYILSDDSSLLYKVKHDLTVLEKIPLFIPPVDETEQLPKSIKPDFEGLSKVSINGFPHLVLIGSGSKIPHRDKGFLIKLPTNYNKKHLVWNFDISPLFQLLRSHEGITTNGEINIEGLAFTETKAYMFNRGNPSGSQNVILSFTKEEMVEYIQGHMEGIPFPKVHPFSLPTIKGVASSFTGGDYYDQLLWYTASAENTSNAYDDGHILGSRIGFIEISESNNGRYAEELLNLKEEITLEENNTMFVEKVESIALFEKDQRGNYTALAVTDNDGASSSLLLLDIIV